MEKDPSTTYTPEEFDDPIISQVIKVRVRERLIWIQNNFPDRWDSLTNFLETKNFDDIADLTCSKDNYVEVAEAVDVPVHVLFFKGIDDRDRFLEKIS